MTPRRLTSPDRVVFEDAGITKGDVAAYYALVARWMLPGVVGRPLSLLRCPDGAGASCFFQKHHADSLGAGVHSITLDEVSGTGEYLYIDNADGLLDLVQLNTLEFHPWGARTSDVEHPDRLVFDLDPDEGIAWSELKSAARDIRDRLAALKLRSWVRLSGGKGLHVVVPVRPKADWAQAKAFCEDFAGQLVTESPKRYVATASKAKREGRIFIDWLRNTRGATSVASWSLRARAGVPVCMPLSWDELAQVRKPGAYDLRKAAKRAESLKQDPWDGFSRVRQTVPSS
ncbi:non-homologous end-joining DNA ligase [Lysobacter sp. GCM10012299]|uniref:non-homologous end-joining DNA ligase n=1 Tax=Lysobacter sp. GCM10012299 TaxID=3317333 RepID=UPI00361AB276